MAKELSAKDVASELGTDPRTLRKFLRNHLPKEDQPGQGGRYTFTKSQVKNLRKPFSEWSSGKADRAEVRRKSKEEDVDDDVEVEIDDIEVEDDDLDEPSAEDLEEIDAEDLDIDEDED